ncbi:MAG TPA: XrtA/PEP-CTERM system TPR-repeat protein PrsT [Burkholderiaceae bacterium]|nr:XrtA/PEP-CTERM system TPR-repeat protein PrsT [Burkholderiaceae bacterium]
MFTIPLRRLAAFAAALATAVTVAACHRADSASMLAQARQASERGEPRAAVIVLKNILQQEPDHRAARLLLGQVYLDLSDPPSAENQLRRARALGASSGQVTLLLGKALLMQGKYEQVLTEIDPAATPAQRPATLALRANALLGQGKIAPARALLDEALVLDGAAPAALLGLARIAVWEKQEARAHTLLQRALAAHPDDSDCLRYRADLLRAAGKIDEAMALQQSILARHPHQVQALVDVANLAIDAGRIPAARQALASARAIAGDSVGLLYAEAMLDFRENKPVAARDKVQRVLRAAPDHYPSVLLAGALQSALGAHVEAAAHLQKFLEMYPGHPYASKLMVSLRLADKQPQAALEQLAPLLEREPNDAGLLALAGEAYLRLGQYSQAGAVFERAAALAPGKPGLHTALALSRIGGGDNARAIAELERAAALETHPGANGVLLVMSYLRAKQPDKAAQAVQEMARQGDNPLIENLKGGIGLARGDLRAARASFERALQLAPAYLPALSNLERLDALEQHPADSRARYVAALARAPHDAALMEALAQLAVRHRQMAEALGWMERARAEQPDALPLALRTGSLYLSAGQPAKAMQLGRQLQARHPSDKAVLALLGQAAVAAGRYPEAVDAYTRLAALLPGAARPHLYLADVLIAQQQEAAARQALDKALALDPGLLDARITLVNLLLRQGKTDQAMATAQALKKIDPDGAAADKLAGDVQSAQGRHAAALQSYQQAFARAPSGPALIQLSNALSRLGRRAEADALAARWFGQHPGDVPTLLHVASTKLTQDDPAGAIPHLEAVLKVEPGNLAALNDLAWSYQRVGNTGALAVAERAQLQAPDNPAVMDTVGWILLEQGKLARARPLLQRASALAPRAPEIHYHYGLLLAKAGDKRAARGELEKALAGGPGFAQRQQARALLDNL